MVGHYFVTRTGETRGVLPPTTPGSWARRKDHVRAVNAGRCDIFSRKRRLHSKVRILRLCLLWAGGRGSRGRACAKADNAAGLPVSSTVLTGREVRWESRPVANFLYSQDVHGCVLCSAHCLNDPTGGGKALPTDQSRVDNHTQ